MNVQRYFFGVFAAFIRFITKNKSKLISSGKIPEIEVALFGFIIKKAFIEVNNQCKGVKGVAKITSLPNSTIPENTRDLRTLWVGCEIKGFLQSPNKFLAINVDECLQALRDNDLYTDEEIHQYITFWRKRLCDNDSFLFENCFEFQQLKFDLSQSRSFGSSLSGVIVNIHS